MTWQAFFLISCLLSISSAFQTSKSAPLSPYLPNSSFVADEVDTGVEGPKSPPLGYTYVPTKTFATSMTPMKLDGVIATLLKSKKQVEYCWELTRYTDKGWPQVIFLTRGIIGDRNADGSCSFEAGSGRTVILTPDKVISLATPTDVSTATVFRLEIIVSYIDTKNKDKNGKIWTLTFGTQILKDEFRQRVAKLRLSIPYSAPCLPLSMSPSFDTEPMLQIFIREILINSREHQGLNNDISHCVLAGDHSTLQCPLWGSDDSIEFLVARNKQDWLTLVIPDELHTCLDSYFPEVEKYFDDNDVYFWTNLWKYRNLGYSTRELYAPKIYQGQEYGAINSLMQGRYADVVEDAPKKGQDLMRKPPYVNYVYETGDQEQRDVTPERCVFRALLYNMMTVSLLNRFRTAKPPPFLTNETVLLRRKADFEVQFLIWACEDGQYVKFPNMLSTSNSRFITHFPGQCIVIQKSKSGIYIADLFGTKGAFEDETLFPPFVPFELNSIYTNADFKTAYPQVNGVPDSCVIVVVMSEKREAKIHHWYRPDVTVKTRVVGIGPTKATTVADITATVKCKAAKTE